jgi:hypothetical protein
MNRFIGTPDLSGRNMILVPRCRINPAFRSRVGSWPQIRVRIWGSELSVKNTRHIGATLGGLFVALLLVSRLSAGESVPTPPMVGHWEGSARIIVIWCQQTNLPVAVDIQADGSVTGKVGDAALINGRFKRNRGWLGRKLNLKTDYIIRGKLTGSVVAAEGITRSGVWMPLNFNDGAFVGSLDTSGWKIGGKKRMILSTARLTLTRTNNPASGTP